MNKAATQKNIPKTRVRSLVHAFWQSRPSFLGAVVLLAVVHVLLLVPVLLLLVAAVTGLALLALLALMVPR